MIFKKEFEIGLSDLNQRVEIKNWSILRCLEDIAGYHSDSLELGINQIHKTGLAWALMDWEVEIRKRPHYGDKLEVHTWSRRNGRSYAYRDFEVFVQGECVIQATSKWVLMDLHKRRPTVIPPEMMQAYDPEYGKSVFGIEELPKLQPREGYELAGEYAVHRRDLDINGHVHNLNYYDIVADTLEDGQEERIDRFRISYRKEIRQGQKVRIYKCRTESGYSFALEGEELHALIEVRFKEL